MQTGQSLPRFELATNGDSTISDQDLLGSICVIYFYPKDNTPGCTRESQDFRDLQAQFKAAGARIIGVSRDSQRSHDNFIAKHELPFTLISDSDETLCRLFDVIKEKNMYGRKVMGIERSTFLFDAEGVLRQTWRKLKVPGHAAEVLTAVQSL